MERRLAIFISYLFHPLFVPAYILLVFLTIPYYLAARLPFLSLLVLAGTVILMTILIPLLFIYVLHRRKLVLSFFMESRQERIYPLLIMAICYYITYYLLKGFPVSMLFSYCMLGLTFLTICVMIISFYHKISLHMTGIGGFWGILVGLGMNLSYHLIWQICAVTLVAGVTGYARLELNSHKPGEVYSGFLVGAVIMYLLFYLV